MGIIAADDQKSLGDPNTRVALLSPSKDKDGYFVYPNFTVLRKWNRSNYFALATSRLAELTTNTDLDQCGDIVLENPTGIPKEWLRVLPVPRAG